MLQVATTFKTKVHMQDRPDCQHDPKLIQAYTSNVEFS